MNMIFWRVGYLSPSLGRGGEGVETAMTKIDLMMSGNGRFLYLNVGFDETSSEPNQAGQSVLLPGILPK